MGKVRVCKKCQVNPTETPRHAYCSACKPIRENRTTGTTKQRGYDSKHVKERKRYARIVKAGRATCARCGNPIAPDAEWHLDHTDDRTGYLGPSHADCNVKAAARPRTVRRTRVRSRDW